ncbi:MAG: SURF1 family protein [Actinobacteria bacterium]|nr:SURF1 family protein [Actinomycetota bacterium]
MSLLRTRRWLGFTAVVVVSIIAFGLLSLWQWHRADDKRLQRQELESALAAEPVRLADITRPSGGGIVPADQWRHVSVTGRYLPESQVLVRKRPLDARNGFWVLTAVQAGDGEVAWVNRGWQPTTGDALSATSSPEPPPGTVTVTGYLRPMEDADPASNEGLPAGQVAAVDPDFLPILGEAFPGYVQLSDSTPPQEDLVALPVPTVDENRNLSYAAQWLIFAFVAIGGWFFFLRREAADDTQRRAAEADVTRLP